MSAEMDGGLNPKRLYSRCRYLVRSYDYYLKTPLTAFKINENPYINCLMKMDKDSDRNDKKFDAQNLLDKLQKLKEADSDMYYKFSLDAMGNNHLEGICWAFPFMAKRAAKIGLNLLIFDTTHETNRFGCYTCVICVENELGVTEVLFLAMIMHQVIRPHIFRCISFSYR